MIAHAASTLDPDLSIAFVCPFTLLRQTGTRIRANMTIEVASRFARCHVISLGGFEGERHHEIEDVWGRRRPTGRQFRLGVFTRKAARVLAEIQPGIVHGFGPLAMAAALWSRRGEAFPRLVLELHGLLAQEVSSHWLGAVLLYRFLDRLAVRRADAIIAMSQSQREILLRRYRVPPERVTVIWGPVDLDLFKYREPSEHAVFRVGYAGNDAPWQGVEDLLAAAQSFQGDGRITFRFIGAQADRFNLPAGASVEFFADASREETAQLLSECDVLMSPRRGKVAETQYPFKMSAYLAVGRPIIATNVSDQRLILEKAGCGAVVPPESPIAIAEAIRQVRIMAHGERVGMGQRARRFAEEHLSMPQFQAALAHVYDGLLGKSAARG